jgi:hypothetical protein
METHLANWSLVQFPNGFPFGTPYVGTGGRLKEGLTTWEKENAKKHDNNRITVVGLVSVTL